MAIIVLAITPDDITQLAITVTRDVITVLVTTTRDEITIAAATIAALIDPIDIDAITDEAGDKRITARR